MPASKAHLGLAMSGGVDSTVAALLLQRQGYRVHGFFMRIGLPREDQLWERLKGICGQLAIPLSAYDLGLHFDRHVISYFTASYRSGLTPNPCVICNQQIKFGLLAQAMLDQGMEHIATGHYARVEKKNGGCLMLRRASDAGKDQSYFLCRLTCSQLDTLRLPLGDLSKSEVRQIARRAELGPFSEGESQDVCFLGKKDLAGFFKDQGVADHPGFLVASDGTILGEHKGLWRYTIGQRRGLNLPDSTPWYVIHLDAENNRVVVGKQDALLQHVLSLTQVRWLDPRPNGWSGLIQLRSRQYPVACSIHVSGKDSLTITLTADQRAITPGQFGVLYDGDQVVGSGVIAPLGEDQPIACSL